MISLYAVSNVNLHWQREQWLQQLGENNWTELCYKKTGEYAYVLLLSKETTVKDNVYLKMAGREVLGSYSHNKHQVVDEQISLVSLLQDVDTC